MTAKKEQARTEDALLTALGAGESGSRFFQPETAQILRQAIRDVLTERQRVCLTLYYGDRLSMQEIAAQLGLTRCTVSKHIHKAVDRLRYILRLCLPDMKIQP